MHDDNWTWLRQNGPKSHDELVGKVKEIPEGTSRTERSTLRKLVRIFAWCRDHDV